MKTITKNFLTVALFASMVYFTACSSDDEGDTGGFSFVDQNAQGTIDGESFTLGEASAEDSFFSEGEFSIELYNSSEDITDVCDLFGFGDQVSVFFDIPAQVGVYELSFDLSNLEDGRTVTLFNPDGANNIIASEGAVEITEITATTVSGRIDARGSESSVNGNWSATICTEE